jgi:hypothetical protein
MMTRRTREEQLNYCSVCLNRKFSPKKGVICGLTNEVATFIDSCDDYSEDEKEKSNKLAVQKDIDFDNKAHIYKAQVVLFIIAIISIATGFLQSVKGSLNIDLIYGFIFLILFIWSFWKPSVAFSIALVFYSLILIIFSFIDINYLFVGWIWKLVTILLLALGLKFANNKQAKV